MQKFHILHAFGGKNEKPPETVRFAKQVHGDISLNVDLVNFNSTLEADGVYSFEDNPCAVQTADCMPLLIGSKDHNFCAAIHAGWKGVCAEIIPKFLRCGFLPAKTELLFAIGPCLSLRNFEIGPEVMAQFLQLEDLKARQSLWLENNADDRWFIDLKVCAMLQILGNGISAEQIDLSPECTFANHNFNSYRRDKKNHTGKVPSNWSWISSQGPRIQHYG